MSELERIRKYIDKTKCRDERYSATISEIDLFARFSADGHPIEAIILAFDYGRAKGYRYPRIRLWPGQGLPQGEKRGGEVTWRALLT